MSSCLFTYHWTSIIYIHQRKVPLHLSLDSDGQVMIAYNNHENIHCIANEKKHVTQIHNLTWNSCFTNMPLQLYVTRVL